MQCPSWLQPERGPVPANSKFFEPSTQSIRRQLRLLHPDSSSKSPSTEDQARIIELTTLLTQRRKRQASTVGKRVIHRFHLAHKEVIHATRHRVRNAQHAIADLRKEHAPATMYRPSSQDAADDFEKQILPLKERLAQAPPSAGLTSCFVPRSKMICNGKVDVGSHSDGTTFRMSGIQLNAYFQAKVDIGDAITRNSTIVYRTDDSKQMTVRSISNENIIYTTCGKQIPFSEIRNPPSGRWSYDSAKRVQTEYLRYCGLKPCDRVCWTVSDAHFSRYVSAAQARSFRKHKCVDRLYQEVYDSVKCNIWLDRPRPRQPKVNQGPSICPSGVVCPW